MSLLKKAIPILLLLLTRSNARPWEVPRQEIKYTGPFVQHFLQELDSWVASVLSQPPVPLVGAGAALAYVGYAGTVLLTSEGKKLEALTPRSAGTSSDLLSGMASSLVNEALGRSAGTSSDLLSGMASSLVNEALGNTESAVAFRTAGARALHHGATVLRRGLNAFARMVGALYSTLSNSRRVLSSDCVAERLCRIGQVTGMQWPLLGVLLRSLDSAELDEYSRALIDGTTIGDCRALYPTCPE